MFLNSISQQKPVTKQTKQSQQSQKEAIQPLKYHKAEYKKKGNYYTITYYKPKSKSYTNYNTTSEASVTAIKLINQYFNNSKQTIKYNEVPDILQKIAVNLPSVSSGRNFSFDHNQMMRNAIEDFTMEISDGGKDITLKEIYQLYERIDAHSLRAQ